MSNVNNNTLPEGWRETTLGEVVDLAQGVAINAKTKHVLADEKTGIPLLKINNLLNNTIDQYANPELVPSQCILNYEDVIYTRTGQVGEVFTNKYGILHNNSFKVIPSSLIEGKFLYWFLKKKSVYNFVQKIASGSVQLDLNHGAFKIVQIKLPPIREQKAIAKVLTSFDDKIELLQEQNKTLEAIAQTIFKEWFGKYQVGDELPEGWSVGVLGDLLYIKYGKDHKKLGDGNIPCYGSGGVMRYVNKALYSEESILIPRKGTLSNLFYINEPFWSVDTMFYSVIKNRIHGRYCYLFLKSIDLASMNVGSAVPSLTTVLLNAIKLVIPSDDIMSVFNASVSSLYQKESENNSQIKYLKKMRDTLLPKLMNGQLRAKM